jgi:hypothetical protein
MPSRFPVARAPQAWGDRSSDGQPTRSPWGLGLALGLLALLFVLLALASGEWMR